MNELLFKIMPFLRKYMSERASNVLSGFGFLSLLLLGIRSLIEYPEVKYSIFIAFIISVALIPISFIILWILDIKHEWDMRIVAVVSPRDKPFPQNAINAKKSRYKYRKPTKKEYEIWGLNKKRKLTAIMKELIYVTRDKLEMKKIAEKLNDPDTPIEEWMKIRNEQEKKQIK